MTATIITGITGQDGSYLAEILLGKGCHVVGVVRAGHDLSHLPAALADRIELIEWDSRDEPAFRQILNRYQPDCVYNLAAYARGSAMYEDAIAIGEVNGLAVTRMLQAILEEAATIRFCQASSSEMFGDATESPQSEDSVFRPVSPYGAAKHYAHTMVQMYRRRYGLFACSAILFNHESPRRGLAYVTRKITHAAAQIKLGLARDLKLGDLEARRDWGFAPDHVRAMWLMMQCDTADDFVVATGETHSVRDFCACAFGHLGLDYRSCVVGDPDLFRTSERVQLVGDASKAKRVLGWQPSIAFQQMVELMVDHDLQLLKQTISS